MTKLETEKFRGKKNKQEQQWSTDAGVLTNNTKTEIIFSSPELNANKLINQ